MGGTETMDRLEGVEALDDAQKTAAETAETVGGFERGFHERARVLVHEGRVEQAEVDERISVVGEAAEGNEHLKLQKLAPNQLGQANIDGGEQSILLAKSMAAALQTANDVEQMRHAAAHEQDHAMTKKLQGELTFEGDEVDHLLLYEGKAEDAGNRETGKSVDAHREGQPVDVYKEGQDLFSRLANRVKGGRAKIRQVMETTGDLSEIQAAMQA